MANCCQVSEVLKLTLNPTSVPLLTGKWNKQITPAHSTDTTVKYTIVDRQVKYASECSAHVCHCAITSTWCTIIQMLTYAPCTHGHFNCFFAHFLQKEETARVKLIWFLRTTVFCYNFSILFVHYLSELIFVKISGLGVVNFYLFPNLPLSLW